MVNILKIGVLASGGGTDLQSIIDATKSGMIDGDAVKAKFAELTELANRHNEAREKAK